MMKKLCLIVGYQCNNNCIFCCNGNIKRNLNKTTAQLKQDLLAARKQGCEYVDFNGGECTVRKDILELVSFAKKQGYKIISITTNGRMLSYPAFTKKIVEAGLNSVIFSIHGHNSKLHDSQTRVRGSFKQLMQGIKNIKRLGIDIGTNTTINKLNYVHLCEIGKLIIKLGVQNSEFIYVDPSGGAWDKFNALVPTLTESAPFVRALLELGIKNKIKQWHVRYYPLCHMPGYKDHISEIHDYETIQCAPDFVTKDASAARRRIQRVKASKCNLCKYKNDCEGIWKRYVLRNGSAELQPIYQNKYLREAKIEITSGCNRSCEFCYLKNRKAEKHAMPENTFRKIIDRLDEVGVKNIKISGGEPLIHPKLHNFLKYARIKKFRTRLVTNGDLLSESFLKKNGKLIYSIHLSFHDLSAKLEKPQLLERFGISYSLNTILKKSTVKKIKAFYDKIQALKHLSEWSLLREFPMPQNGGHSQLNSAEMASLIEQLLEFKRKGGKKVFIANPLPYCAYFPEKVSKVIDYKCSLFGSLDNFTIDYFGNIKPCSMISSQDINFVRMSKAKLANQNIFDDIKIKLYRDMPQICKECTYFTRCQGGCRAVVKIIKGNYGGLDPLANPEKYIKT